jgi:histidine triad (HIT) family protein
MKDCIFCKIAKGKEPCHKIYEDESMLAFAPLQETIIGKGHMLIMPKRHYADIYELPTEEMDKIMRAIKYVATRLREKFNANGVNLLHASGKAAQQSCFHFHMHLIPRYQGDNLDTWPKTGYVETNFLGVYKDLQKIFE